MPFTGPYVILPVTVDWTSENETEAEATKQLRYEGNPLAEHKSIMK